MTIVPRSPFPRRNLSRRALDMYSDFAPFFAEFDRLMRPLAGESRQGAYATDLYETNDGLVLEMAVPGVKADQIDVSIEGRQLTVRGNSESVESETSDDRRYWLQSIRRGEFVRTITVPTGVRADEISASVTDGILRVVMPKAPEAVARKIAVAEAGAQVAVPAAGEAVTSTVDASASEE